MSEDQELYELGLEKPIFMKQNEDNLTVIQYGFSVKEYKKSDAYLFEGIVAKYALKKDGVIWQDKNLTGTFRQYKPLETYSIDPFDIFEIYIDTQDKKQMNDFSKLFDILYKTKGLRFEGPYDSGREIFNASYFIPSLYIREFYIKSFNTNDLLYFSSMNLKREKVDRYISLILYDFKKPKDFRFRY